MSRISSAGDRYVLHLLLKPSILILGITISKDGQYLAAGGNENKVIVWTVSGVRLEMLTELRHLAAIKALDFCPWLSPPTLLATGAGSNDRQIRVWHFTLGTLVKALPTPGQITSVTWLRTRRELVVTFGHSFSPSTGVVSIYSYPDFDLVARAPDKGLRAFNASVSPDQQRIAVATQDGMVRMYQLWKDEARDEEGALRVLRSAELLQMGPIQNARDFDSSIILLVENMNTGLVLR